MKTSRIRTVLSIAVLSLAAFPLSACSKRADASTQGAPGGTDAPVAPAPSDSPTAGSSDRGDGAPRAKDGRGRRQGPHERGDRAGGKRLQRLREILKSAGVSREQTQAVFQRLRAERARGGPVAAEKVLADVAPSLSQEQREEATKIIRESTDAPAAD